MIREIQATPCFPIDIMLSFNLHIARSVPFVSYHKPREKNEPTSKKSRELTVEKMVGEVGFEPTKAEANGFTVRPF